MAIPREAYAFGCLGGRLFPPLKYYDKEVGMIKPNGLLKAFISFWSWMLITLSAFFLFVLATVSKTVPRPAIIVFALVILALSIAAPVINPGIFAKRHTTATGDCGD